MSSPLMQTYKRLPVEFISGSGAWLTDTRGVRYLDALSGISVCSLGHTHPRVTRAITQQAARLVHTSNLYGIPLQEELAGRLRDVSGLDQVFFGNSGAEANEAAIKICRRHAHVRGIQDPVIVVMEGSFHGRTMATLTATGNPKIQEGFAPLLTGFQRLPYGDAGALRNLAAGAADHIVAVMLEPILGEGGIVLPPPGYLATVREICSEHGWLMVLDEIQTGMCRTGAWFAWQHESTRPDIMTLAKALGNGVPIGACLATTEAAAVLGPGNHGSTFGGNPLAASAGIAVMEVMADEALRERVSRLGETILDGFRSSLGTVNGVREIRGRGLMLGIELDRDCGELVAMALEQRLLINVTAGKVIRLLPPFVLTDEEAGQIVDILSPLVIKFLGE